MCPCNTEIRAMIQREYGSSGMRVSVLSLGCWPIAGLGWSGVNDEDSIATIQQALDIGMNFIDTAYMYGPNGESEILVGKAIAGRRDEAFVATKCGIHWKGKTNCHDSSPERIKQELEESLRRLNIDTIDLYQVHWPDKNTPFEETAKVLDDLLKEGKIRSIGVSNYNVEQMEAFSKSAPIHSLQPQYSMLKRDIENEILPYCIEHNIATCVYCPLGRGLLTDRIRPAEEFPPDDARRDNPDFLGENFQRTKRMAEKLKSIADGCNCTLAQLTLNWTIHQPGVTVAIVGATRPHQVLENAAAVDFELTEDQLNRINEIVNSW